MAEQKTTKKDLQYGIDSSPPWYLCLLFGFQHYLTMFGSTVAVPFIVTPALCVTDNVAKAEIIGTIFFTSGIVTFIQTTVGIRLPIVQGGTFSYIGPIFALMSLPKWKCPSSETLGVITNSTGSPLDVITNSTRSPLDVITNSSGSPFQFAQANLSMDATNITTDDPDIWKSRMREVQGAIIVSSLFQIFVGLSGVLGFLLKFIGPLTIAPTITLIGLALFEPAALFCSKQWGIACLTIILITVFSQYLSGVEIPILYRKTKYPVFRLFPSLRIASHGRGRMNDARPALRCIAVSHTCTLVWNPDWIVLAIMTSWLTCLILTYSGALSDDPKSSGYGARTDVKVSVLRDTKWFRFPYPGQWGYPTVSIAGVLGMLAGGLAGMLESIGDYYACARLSGAPPPPNHAVNRGMMIEGLGCMLAGFWGTGSGTTSYSENIGAIGITKVASRRVVQAGALLMVVLGVLGKIGALFVTIPDPIIGGVFMVMFGMITAVGISNLQYVDLNSSRNLFVFGISTFIGFTVSYWIGQNPYVIKTGWTELDQIITVLLRTSMFVGGFLAVLLDNTIPGTEKERGILAMKQQLNDSTEKDNDMDRNTYDIPLITERLRRMRWTSYIPVSPTFKEWRRKGHNEVHSADDAEDPSQELRHRPNAQTILESSKV